jgi:diacylglycerol kinase (ATP)
MTKIGVIVHEGKELGQGLEEFRAILADLGHPDPPWYSVSKSRKAPKKIRKLVDKHGVDRVIVWGGDGTVRRCIHTVLDDGIKGVSVGIMPAGTANLLAVNLGIPTDLAEAARIAVTGDARPIDVGVINGQHFAVMAGTGFDAMMIADADDTDVKERFGRLGYVWAAVTNTGISPATAEVDIDGKEWYRGDASCVIIANVGTIIGGLTAFPDASPTDGRLDVGVISARTKLEWARVLTAAAVRRSKRSPLADVVTAATITIRLDRSLPWEVDGGERDRTDTYEIRCLPAAIRIAQPSTTS